MKNLLEVKNISLAFGGLKAVDDLSFNIETGGLVGLIGPNGAGKTTAFNILTGVYKPNSGQVILSGEEIQGRSACQVARCGVTRTFQNIRLFKGLSVLDNVLTAMNPRVSYGFLSTVLQSPYFFKEQEKMRKKAFEILQFFNLERKADWQADSLPYGDQRKLEIVRALATGPKLLFLDEPAAGLNHAETAGLMELIRKIRKEFNLTVLLIEHDMKLVMGICEKIVVLDHGKKIAEGTPQQIQANPDVIEAYLGVEEEADEKERA